MLSRKLVAILLLSATLSLAGCPMGSPQLEVAASGTVNGQVSERPSDETPSQGGAEPAPAPPSEDRVSGATVMAFRVEVDGSLSALGGAATTDANGSFSLRVPANTPNLVLKATKGTLTRFVVMSQSVAVEGQTTVKPMTTESSVEARVFAKMVADGAQAAAVDTVTLMERISSEAAEQANESEAAIATLATSLRHSQEARLNALKAQGETDAELALAYSAQVSAYAAWSARVQAATTIQSTQEAYAEYRGRLISAYTEAGVTLESQMKANEAAAAAMVRFAGNSGSALKLAIAKEAARQKAQLRQQAAEIALAALNASQARLAAAADASVQVSLSLDAASDLAAINQAFQGYHDAMLAVLSGVVGDAHGSVAVSALMEADASINGASSPSATAVLGGALGLSLTPSAVVVAYQTFYASVQAQVQEKLASIPGLNVAAVASIKSAISLSTGF